MGTIVNMTGKRKGGQHQKLSETSPNDSHTNRGFSYRLFLIVGINTFTMIEWLREALEAPSFGDVIRLAVRAYAVRFVQAKQSGVHTGANVNKKSCGDNHEDFSNSKAKRLNLRVPSTTMTRLEFLKKETGLSYTEIIISGIKLLISHAKHEESLLKHIGDNPSLEGEKKMGNDKHRSGLACVNGN